MAGKLSYSIVVNMITDGIKKGAATFRSELQSMQYKTIAFVSALGFGGLGLGNFASKLMEAARETNRANTALKNISTTSEAFAQNQKWLIQLSSKYGVQINTLTLNFAKFTAAANSSNVSMQDQKKIFESMSRASVAFSLTADDTNLAFLAVTQMMSKGKISSEELRRQLGEKIPIAMAAMARATGKPINQLDKLLKSGSLLSSEILPKFAEEMNKMLPDVNTDNLETSLSRLSNAFVKFTKGTGIQDAYKSTVDNLTKLTEYASTNISAIFDNLVAIVSALVLGKLFGAVAAFFAKTKAGLQGFVSQSLVANEQVLLATANRIKAEEALAKAKLELDAATDTERLAYKTRYEKAQLALTRASDKEKKAIEVQRLASEKASQVSSLTGWRIYWATMRAVAITAWTAIKSAFATFIPMAAIYGFMMLIQKMSEARKRAEELRTAMRNYKNDVSNAGENSNAVKDLKYQYSVATDMKKKIDERAHALNAINAMLGTNYTINTKTLKIEGDINGKYKERLLLLKKESEFKAIQDKKRQIEAKIEETANGTGLSVEKLQSLVSTYVRSGANKATGDNYPKEFNQSVSSAIKGLGIDAGSSPIAASKAYYGIINAVKSIASQNAVYNQANRDESKFMSEGIGLNKSSTTLPTGIDPEETPLSKAEKEYTDKMKELANLRALELISVAEYNKKWDEQNKETTTKIGGILGSDAAGNSVFNLAKKGIDNPLTSKTYEEEKKYQEALAEYNNQLANGSIKQADYNEAIDKLNAETYAKIGGILGSDAAGNSVFNLAKAGVGNPLTKKIDKVQAGYADELEKLTKAKQAGALDEAAYSAALQELIGSTVDLAASILGADAKTNEFYNSLLKQREGLQLPSMLKRDSTFDYKKNSADIAGERLDVANENIDRIKDSIGDSADALEVEIEKGKLNLAQIQAKYSSIAPQFIAALNTAVGEGKSLEDMLKIAEVKEDIKGLSREISKGMSANFRDIVGSAERIGSNIDAMTKAFSNVDSSGWEKIKSVWSFLFDTIDSFTQILENVKNLTELTQMLTKAKQTEAIIDSQVTAKKVANVALGTGAELAGAAVSVETAGTQVAANTAAAASDVGASAAKLPFPLNLIAIGGGIAAVIAMFAGLPKFANGGIVGGSTKTGDKILARLNAGELILNQNQQDALYGAMGKGGGNLSANIRIKGSDLFISLRNHMKKTGQKL